MERYFKQQFSESKQFIDIGSWWEAKGNQNQIDIVALCTEKMKAVAAEVKRQRKNYNASDFALKLARLKDKALRGYEIEQIMFEFRKYVKNKNETIYYNSQSQ